MSINNVGGNIGGTGGIQGLSGFDLNTEGLSIADRTALVMLEKSTLLEGQLNDYVNRVHEQNEKLKTLGEIQSKLRNMQTTTNTVDSPTWTVDHNASPKQIDLDNGHSLLIHGEHKDWSIRDANGNETRIWGDPHVTEGDTQVEKSWDFQENATFVLGDGTKIHVDVKDIGAEGVVTDKLTITKGNQSIEVTDIAINQPQIGNPELMGAELDQATNDGHVFKMGDQADDWVHMQGDAGREIGADGWENVTEGMGAIDHEGSVMGATDGIGGPSGSNINSVLSQDELALLSELGINIFDSSNLGMMSPIEIQNLDATIKSSKESLTSISQIDMVKLQSLNGKYEQTNALASQIMKTQYQEVKSIIRNI